MALTYTDHLRFLRAESFREATDVTQSGDFIVRGDTLTWWPVTELASWRYHYFGEGLERTEVRNGETWQAQPERVVLEPNQLVTEHGTVRPGEYVVHPNHGVGIFEYLTARESDGAIRRFVSLQYAGNDRLLFPYDRMAELMPYIGMRHPRLTRLYSKSWQKTKERVQKDLIRVARELLTVYANRQLATRPVYPVGGTWEAMLAQAAGFDLTADQQKAMNDIHRDLQEVPHPMDRLVCGDVGFGKTEVAMRAAAAILESGRQVAMIAPTTVLAEQHYALLCERFNVLPVTVAHMSRLTAGKDKETLAGLAEGKIDLVVGTHRLLSKSVAFKDLGLLIVDEEQKFGVAQKEVLKTVRPAVDVLSLSATPIPRTLSMSLSGLRGLSILRTAPTGRKPVTTTVADYRDATLSRAMKDELKRNGQIYVVHNRVQSLGSVRERVMDLLTKAGYAPTRYEEGNGDCQVALAHGQMDEKRLAQTMSDFMAGRVQVLVASSIVEHGLDSPGANTLIVLHSEWFGLSDLYQLRGRVGRRQRQAHAYFLLGGIERDTYRTSDEKIKVTEDARRRLQALQEADELGSGWSVALRDLEIRGGGNILGNEQHGSMEAIGLLLYAQLLQEEIGRQAKLRGLPLFHIKEPVE